MIELPGQVTLWRCAGCGKWSHARRRPAWHERTIKTILNAWGDEFEECQWWAEGEREDGRTRSDAQAQAADWELPVIEVQPAASGQSVVTNVHGDPEPDEWYVGESVTVKCGPFVEYTAYLRAQWSDDQCAREHASALSAEAADDGRAVAASGDVAGVGPVF